MALTLYLAMTAAEILGNPSLPAHIAWMACHFSPYGNGLSNTPTQLPVGAALILNDRIPLCGHDPQIVAGQLAQAVEELAASRVLLDFQRPGCPETGAVAKAITDTLSCPVAVTPAYAENLPCAVFLTPQLRKALSEQLEPWKDRQIWLDVAPDCETVTVTEQGSVVSPGAVPEMPQIVHTDEDLHCRYCIELEEDCARFTVWRDTEQLQALLQDAEKAGVCCALGLYQQLKDFSL